MQPPPPPPPLGTQQEQHQQQLQHLQQQLQQQQQQHQAVSLFNGVQSHLFVTCNDQANIHTFYMLQYIKEMCDVKSRLAGVITQRNDLQNVVGELRKQQQQQQQQQQHLQHQQEQPEQQQQELQQQPQAVSYFNVIPVHTHYPNS